MYVPPMHMHDRSSRTLFINLHHCVRHQNLTTFIFCTLTDIRLVYYIIIIVIIIINKFIFIIIIIIIIIEFLSPQL